MSMQFPLRCRCGSVEGQLDAPQRASRAVCYCRDCQAFARFLGEPERILDAAAGTDIVATTPRYVRFTRGHDQLRCMSLSGNGLLRWYAACCRTPIGNTPRDPRLSYVGLVHACLAGSAAERDAAFGPTRVAINTASARGKVRSTPVAGLLALARIFGRLAAARLSGGYRSNPFFDAATGGPIVAPQVLSAEQRHALRGGT